MQVDDFIKALPTDEKQELFKMGAFSGNLVLMKNKLFNQKKMIKDMTLTDKI